MFSPQHAIRQLINEKTIRIKQLPFATRRIHRGNIYFLKVLTTPLPAGRRRCRYFMISS